LIWRRHKEKVVLHEQSPSARSIAERNTVWEDPITGAYNRSHGQD
jgi:hypothetical protein